MNNIEEVFPEVTVMAANLYEDSKANGLTLCYVDVASYMVGYLQGKLLVGQSLAPFRDRIMAESYKIAGIEYGNDDEENELNAISKLVGRINSVARS